jgi:threonine/homoserine/homoserine lactone efflux protein
MNIFIEGILMGISITAPVGPTNVEVIRRGVQNGWRASAAFCLGSLVALILYLTLVTLGFSKVSGIPWFNTTLTIFGVIVLGYLAYNSFKEYFSAEQFEFVEEEAAQGRHFVPGIILTVANPAVLLFWTGIMGARFTTNTQSSNLPFVAGILLGALLTYIALNALIIYARRLLQQKLFKVVSLAAGLLLTYFCLMFSFDLVAPWLAQ